MSGAQRGGTCGEAEKKYRTKSAKKKLSSIRDLKGECVNASWGSYKLRLGVAQKDECEERGFGQWKGIVMSCITLTLIQG